MRYIADLHVHSHYSRATSKDLNLESLYKWARIKGIHVVGTGDFTHPEWFEELRKKLVPDGSGFFKLKNPPEDEKGFATTDVDVRFCLTTEISSIYKHGDRVRKNHNLVYAPDLDTVARINHKLSAIGNLKADGRPILGLPSRDLLEIVLETSGHAHLIPAHVWTPWFSTLGSKAGYDSIAACFRDLTDHIFALETGLSSDPIMNRKLSALDRFTLISNSDAHSPAKLGREANLLDTELGYEAMFNAFRTGEGFLSTYEFYPEEGKYHHDGHRKCNVSFNPKDTKSCNNICPQCGKPLTVGVLHRVEELADREESALDKQLNGKEPSQRPLKHENSQVGNPGYRYLIPLPEVLSEIEGVGPKSKTVYRKFQSVISSFGNEFDLLHRIPVEDIHRKAGPVLAEAIRRIRENKVTPVPGYDGVYGIIRVFEDGEVERIRGQLGFFGPDEFKIENDARAAEPQKEYQEQPDEKAAVPEGLNPEQETVRQALNGATLVTAGPGTGKTHTLIEWMVHQIESGQADPRRVLAVTFTNKAADELQERLKTRIGDKARFATMGTFHALAWRWLREWDPALRQIVAGSGRKTLLRLNHPGLKNREISKACERIAIYMELGGPLEPGDREILRNYEAALEKQKAADLSGLIRRVVDTASADPGKAEQLRKRYKSVAIDEFQDINPVQYQLVKLFGTGKNLLAIGDADQSIYSFRGSDVRLFFRFAEDFSAKEIALKKNYRSTGTILDAAGEVIANNSNRRGKPPLSATKGNGDMITVCRASNPFEEADYILDQIEKYVGGIDSLAGGKHTDSGHSYGFGDIAVLFRTNAIGDALFKSFLKTGIPVHFGDGTAFLAEPPFTVIPAALKLCLNPDDPMLLADMLSEAYGWKPDDIRSLQESLHSNPVPLFGNQPLEGISEPMMEDLDHLRRFMRKIWEIINPPGVSLQKNLANKEKTSSSEKKTAGTDSLGKAVKIICSHYLPDGNLTESQQLKMETLMDLAEEAGDNPEKFLEQMQLNPYTDAGRLESQGVQLLSFHASKGLEFPVVFIAGAEEGITPILREDSDTEEERRLFYVAMTRAKEELQITHVSERVRYGEKEQMKPSRFIREIPDGYKIVIETKKPKRSTEEEKNRQMGLF